MDPQPLETDQSGHHHPRVLVAGEALIDLVPSADHPGSYHAIPGGSPFNVAVGLSRLNIPTGFLGKVSTDPFGQQLKTTLRGNGVGVGFVQDDSGPTQLALVTQKPGQEPQYAFYGHQTADANLEVSDLPVNLPAAIRAIHFGSLALIAQPTGATLTHLMRRESRHRIISLDPNVRPSRIPDITAYARQLEEWITLSHIVKLSQADLAVVFPAAHADEVAAQWLAMGPQLIVITQGANGATAYVSSSSVHVPAPAIQLMDTVGAGDAFTSGLLAWLDDHAKLSIDSLQQLDSGNLRLMLQFATQVAALTCGREGADPPHRSELAI